MVNMSDALLFLQAFVLILQLPYHVEQLPLLRSLGEQGLGQCFRVVYLRVRAFDDMFELFVRHDVVS